MPADAIPDIVVWMVFSIPIALLVAAMYFFFKALLADKDNTRDDD